VIDSQPHLRHLRQAPGRGPGTGNHPRPRCRSRPHG